MGLDMYLEGEKFLFTNWLEPEKNQMLDGFQVKKIVVELGYWRKVPDLHGYIVREFQGGEDECQRTELQIEDLHKILDAVKKDQLPHTKGFFFGEQRPEDKKPTIKTLETAIAWLATEEKGVSRSVFYRASW